MGFRTSWPGHALLLLAAGLALAQDGAPPAGEEPTEPLDLGIEEYTERRLAQIDVAVSGPPEVIGNLGPSDFELFVGNLVLGGAASGRWLRSTGWYRCCREIRRTRRTCRARRARG